MNKNSTLFYILDNRDKETGFILSSEDLVNHDFDEHKQVLSLLKTIEFSPSKKTVNKLFDYAANV